MVARQSTPLIMHEETSNLVSFGLSQPPLGGHGSLARRRSAQTIGTAFFQVRFSSFSARRDLMSAASGERRESYACAFLSEGQEYRFVGAAAWQAEIAQKICVLRRWRVLDTTREKTKLVNRVRRIRGQIEAVERALDGEIGCSDVLQLITSARGAVNGLMAEVIEDYIRMRVADPLREPDTERALAAQELIDIVHSYLK